MLLVFVVVLSGCGDGCVSRCRKEFRESGMAEPNNYCTQTVCQGGD